MSSSRRRGFVLGTAIFSILAVGTLLAFNKLISLIVFQVIGVEPNSEWFLATLISGVLLLLILAIALPTISTRYILRKFN